MEISFFKSGFGVEIKMSQDRNESSEGLFADNYVDVSGLADQVSKQTSTDLFSLFHLNVH